MTLVREFEGANADFSILEPKPTDWKALATGTLAWLLMLALWAALAVTATHGPIIASIGAAFTSYFVLSAVRGSYVRDAYLEVEPDGLVLVHDGALRRAVAIPFDGIRRIEVTGNINEDGERDLYWPVPTIGAFEPNLAIFFVLPMRLPMRSLMSRFRLENPEQPGATVQRLEEIQGIGLTLADPEAAAAAIREMHPGSDVRGVHEDELADPVREKVARRRFVSIEREIKQLGFSSNFGALSEILDSPEVKASRNLKHLIGRQVGKGDSLEGALPLLKKLLDDEDGITRTRAVEVIAAEKSLEATPALLEALRDPDPYVRLSACKALGDLGDPVVAPALVEALRDERRSVRYRAARGLAQLGIPETLPLLFQLYVESSRYGRASASANLETALVAAAATSPDQPVDFAASKLSRSRGILRIALLNALFAIGNSRAVDSLVEVLLSSRLHRRVALRALLEIDDPRALPAMKRVSRRMVFRGASARQKVAEMEARHSDGGKAG